MSLNLSDLVKTVKVLVERKGVQLADKRIEKIRRQTVQALKSWRLYIRFLLGRKYPGGRVRNTTAYPKMRTGNLRNSVPTYDVSTRKTFKGSHNSLGQTVISLHQRNLKYPWITYGERLNKWSYFVPFPTKLTGWKDRAYQMLDEMVNLRIKGIKGYE